MENTKNRIRDNFGLARMHCRIETDHFRASAFSFTAWVIFWLLLLLAAWKLFASA